MSDVRLNLQTENAKKKFIKLMQKCDDMSSVFTEFINEYKEIVLANFGSRGRIMEREGWKNYTPAYYNWKKHSKFASQPMGQLTDALIKAAYDFKSDIGKKSLVMRVEGADYFYYFQERKTNPRHYFMTPDDDMPIQAWKILIKEAEDFLMKDME
jgi:hypothetical protein